jgi:hypothetical protein
MYNVIDFPTTTNNAKGRRNMTKFASKQGSGWNHLDFTYD